MKYKANQVRICVSDSREDEVDDEQVYQDVKEMIDAFQVNCIILSHEFRMIDNMTILNLTIWQNLAKKQAENQKLWHHLFQAGDKDSFKLQLNHVLCCRPWGVLPDMLDLFEQKNHGRRDFNMHKYVQHERYCTIMYNMTTHHTSICKNNMIRYEVIDRQIPGPL